MIAAYERQRTRQGERDLVRKARAWTREDVARAPHVIPGDIPRVAERERLHRGHVVSAACTSDWKWCTPFSRAVENRPRS